MHAPNGEVATELSAPMLEALHALIAAIPQPACVPNMRTAVALLNRGMIERHTHGVPLDTRSLYYITESGHTAYRITRKQMLGKGLECGA